MGRKHSRHSVVTVTHIVAAVPDGNKQSLHLMCRKIPTEMTGVDSAAH